MTAEELAHALGAKRSGRQWVCKCVAHEDSSPSMIIFDGRAHVQVRCLAGCEPEAIIEVLKSRGLWEANGPDSNMTQERRNPREQRDENAKHDHRMRLLARGIFDEAKSIRGSLAETYLESRDIYRVALMIDDIRYHGMCPRYAGPQYKVQPAIIVAMRNISTNAIAAIQRIFLTRDGKKDGKGMMLAPTGGTAMKLLQLQNHELHICEGLETGLGLIAMEKGPVWALGSSSNIQSFEPIETIKKLIIWADNDDAGLKAADACKLKWLRAGKEIEIFKPAIAHRDMHDVWNYRNAH